MLKFFASRLEVTPAPQDPGSWLNGAVPKRNISLIIDYVSKVRAKLQAHGAMQPQKRLLQSCIMGAHHADMDWWVTARYFTRYADYVYCN